MDEKIIGLADGTVQPAPSGDGRAIARHVAAAAFDQTQHSAEEWGALGTPLIGCIHPSNGAAITSSTMLTSLEAHTAKRVREGRWKTGTTPPDYLQDLQSAASATVRVKVGRHFHGHAVASTVAPVSVLPSTSKCAKTAGHYLFVVYNAGKRVIVSGYSEPEQKIAELHKAWKKLRIIPL